MRRTEGKLLPGTFVATRVQQATGDAADHSFPRATCTT
jgi:hypothetical protein